MWRHVVGVKWRSIYQIRTPIIGLQGGENRIILEREDEERKIIRLFSDRNLSNYKIGPQIRQRLAIFSCNNFTDASIKPSSLLDKEKTLSKEHSLYTSTNVNWWNRRNYKRSTKYILANAFSNNFSLHS